MPERPRRIADRYEVSPLDGGGMARVWRGYDTVLDRLVAIKQIRSDRHHTSAMRQQLAERFRREARVTAKIEHPGVPAVYDAAIDRAGDDSAVEHLYLVMQLVRGVTVADLLAEHGQFPIPWAIAVAAQVCAVLSHAHAIPVVHRDLKPSNVMVDKGGNVKVLDFGVAAVLGTDVTQLTEAGQIIGSRDYMSPEQFHGVAVTPRSDLYALGCLLHEMLTGRKVFESVGDPALQHVHADPTPVRALRPEADEAIERLILELLEKAPEDRPASAQEVYDRLSPFLPAPGSSTQHAWDGLTPPAERLPDPTTPYRRPLAPRRDSDPAVPHDRARPAFGPAADQRKPRQVVDMIRAAEDEAAALVDESRFTQAVRVLEDALSVAASELPAEDPRLLELRNTYAAALFLGRDLRRALPAFQELAAAYARIAGPDDERVRECRRQIAFCQAELGDTESALAGFRQLLAEEVRRGRGNRHAEALEVRRQIGILLLAAHRRREAAEVLRAVRDDLFRERGADDPDVREVANLLARIRLTTGSVGQ